MGLFKASDLARARMAEMAEQMQLEAMFPDEFCPLYDSAAVEELKSRLGADPEETLRSVAAHPPLELLLQMTVPDERPPDEVGGKQLVASILLRIAFPPLYPTPGTPPEFRFEDVMITDALEEIGLDKVLWPEVNLDVDRLITEMQQMAADIQP